MNTSVNVKRKDLVRAAQELNDLLGLEPKIDTNQDDATLKQLILEASELLEPEDDVSEATLALIDQLQKAEVEEEEEEVAEVEEEAEEEEEEEEEEVEPPPEEPPKTKAAPKIAKSEKPAPKTKPEKAAARKPAEPKKAPSQQQEVTRIGTVAAVLKKWKEIKVTKLIQEADAQYTKLTGRSSNLKESKYAVRVALQALEAFGVVEVEGDLVKNVLRGDK